MISLVSYISYRREKRKILKNLVLISFAFLCNFIAFGGTSSLQSSLNYEDGLGVGSLSILYAALILSAMFLPTIGKLPAAAVTCVTIIFLWPVGIVVTDIAIGAGDFGFYLQAGQIGHSVVYASPPLRHFFGALLLPRREAAEMDSVTRYTVASILMILFTVVVYSYFMDDIKIVI